MTDQIRTETLTITTVGGAGAAVGSATMANTPFGILLDIYLNYHASCPNTADVTVTEPVFGTIVVKSNNATDIRIAPVITCVDATATAVSAYINVPLNGGPLTVSIAEADALTGCLVATIRWLSW